MMGKFLNFRKGWTSKNLRCFQNYDFIKWQIEGETVETVADFIFFLAPKSLQMVIAAVKLKDAYSKKK